MKPQTPRAVWVATTAVLTGLLAGSALMSPRPAAQASAGTATPAVAASPTFSRDVAPILYENCTGCHRTGQIAPFPLETYGDVAEKGRDRSPP